MGRGAGTETAADTPRAQQALKAAGMRISHGADRMGKTLRIQTLRAEIMFKESTVRSLKAELGPLIYEALEKGDRDGYMQAFLEQKAKVDAVIAEVDKRRAEIEDLERARAAIGDGDENAAGNAQAGDSQAE